MRPLCTSPRCRRWPLLLALAALLLGSGCGSGDADRSEVGEKRGENGSAVGERQPPDGDIRVEVDALFRRAVAHVREGRLDSARVLLRAVLEGDPTHYEAALGLAEIDMRGGRFEAALAPLRHARDLSPERPEARLQLARSLMRLDRKPEAIAELRRLVSRQPGHGGARMMLADLLMTKAPPDPHGALAQYEEILRQRPDFLPAREGAAASRLRVGRFAEAAEQLAALVAADSTDEELPFLLGTAYYWLGRYDDAVGAYRLAVDALAPGSPRLAVRRWNLRLAWLAAGRDAADLEPPYAMQLADRARRSPVQFTDVAGDLGLAKVDRGRGSVWQDFDGDGRLDLVSVGIQVEHAFYRGTVDGFDEQTEAVGLRDARGGWSATAADADGDGDPDLYVTRDAWEGAAPNSLYRADRGLQEGGAALRFVDIAAEAGVAGDGDSFTATWADVDGDGRPDLYVAEGITGSGAANKLYMNRGNGAFVERAAEWHADVHGKSLGVAFGDVDGDGDVDLYVADVGGPNTLLRNDGDRFTDITSQAGVERPVQGGYVAFFSDLDVDGDLDLFVSAMCFYEQFVESQVTGRAAGPRAHLYRNDGALPFVEIGGSRGLDRSFGSMGAGYGDVDYDGLVDIYLANGGPALTRLEPNILLHNRADGFADVTNDAGVGTLGKGHGATFADYDEDGDLDLYAGVGGHYPGDVWSNSLDRNEGHGQHWIGIDIADQEVTPLGATIRLRAGERTVVASRVGGDGFGSMNGPVVPFGLGDATAVDTVEIRWPGGRAERLIAPAVDRVHIVGAPGTP
jgi:tetratricopeptide (TPR) repeat protein